LVEINLLEWRSHKFHYERRVTRIIILSAVAFAVLLMFIVHYLVNAVLIEQVRQVKVLSAKLSDSTLPSSSKPEASIQDPVSIVAILNAIGRSRRSGICYTRLVRDEAHFALTGKARSLVAVTSGLQMIEASTTLPAIKLREIKRATDEDALQFLLESGGG